MNPKGVPVAKSSGPHHPDRLSRFQQYAEIIRAVGTVIGIPVIAVIALQLLDLKSEAAKEQLEAKDAQIETLNERIKTLEALSSPNLMDVIESKNAQRDELLRLLRAHASTTGDKPQDATTAHQRADLKASLERAGIRSTDEEGWCGSNCHAN